MRTLNFFLLRDRCEDGAFTMHVDGEVDIR